MKKWMFHRSIFSILTMLSISGCTSLSAEWQHVSHPLLGPPFGPRNEEDSLDVLNGCGERRKENFYVEMCLGYRLRDGGFFGDDFIYTGRFGVRKELRK